MSNKSSSPSQVISLPKGGGALHGIGEKFAPDLHTGTGNFTVPIALPPGRNGFQPQLNLVYSTGNGNGPFGLGWSLSIPGVSRKTSKGVPRYDNSLDTFILSGAEDLVPISSSTDQTRYLPRTEGLFARITHHHNVGNDFWEVRSKDGLVSFYGTQSAAGNDAAALADPHRPDHIFAWKLTETRDQFSNRIEYDYVADKGKTEFHEWDQPLLRQIRYADYTDQGQTKFLVTVGFKYEDRLDAFSEYRAGFEIRTTKLCKIITVKTHADQERTVRSYELNYENDLLNGVSLLREINVKGHDGDKTESLPPLEFGYTQFDPDRRDFFPLTGPGLPSNSLANPDFELVSLFGNGLSDVLEMNGTVRYWRNRGGGRFDLPREMKDAPAGFRLADRGVQLIDANGDGRMDLLISTENLAGYFPLRFGGLWDRRSFRPYDFAPSFNLEDPEVRLVDLDGDGVTDAIRAGTRLECFFNDPEKGWNRTRRVERRALKEFPNVNFSDSRVRWADLTGDTLQDIVLVYDGNVEYWPNLGHGDWGKRIHMENSPNFPEGYDPRRILVGDVDGDGLADIVYVDHCKVMLWINQSGNGWSEPITIPGTPTVSDIDAVRLADALGTGVSGLLWSRDADGLSRETMFFLDFTGGIKPYLLSEMNNHMGAVTRVGYSSSTRFYLDDEKRPETGWKTTLPFPVQVVARVEVIDEISGGKLTTEYSYHHGYWDGAEREFRGFGRVDQRDTEVFADFHATGLHPSTRSFEAVSQQTFSPPTETRTWFHQGPIGDEFGEWRETDFSSEFWPGDPQLLNHAESINAFLKTLTERRVRRDALRTLRGSILRTELYALDSPPRAARPYTVTELSYGLREESPPASTDNQRPHSFFPHALAERTTQWERGDEPMTQFKFIGDYDQYGLSHSQISIAVPRGRDFRIALPPNTPHESYLATYTVTDYAQREDDQRYIVDRVARATTHEIINDGQPEPTDGSPALFDLVEMIKAGSANKQLIGQTLNFYDGPEFHGLGFKELGIFGALVRTESLVLTDKILEAAYHTERPHYIVPNPPPVLGGDYPAEFDTFLPFRAGYIYRSGGDYEPSYFAATERRKYDFQEHPEAKGLIKITRDPLDHDTTIGYDTYNLLPISVTDSVGLTTEAVYDYRVLQPKEVTDPNGNKTFDTFTPLGLLEKMFVVGKNGEGDIRNVSDPSLDKPSTNFEYKFTAFFEDNQPVSVRTTRRVHHVNDTGFPAPEDPEEKIETVEYSDGFGRLLQTRTQAEDIAFGDPIFGDAGLPADQSLPGGDAVGHPKGEEQRVVVSGWQIYDNKGRVVEKFEPFFSEGWDYATPTDAERGQKVTMFYDPRGHVIRTVNPDGSEQRVIFGVPGNIADPDLSNPDVFEPTPWEAYTYDANDNAGRTHPDDPKVKLFDHHWHTPSSAVVDALGRTVETIERNREKLRDGSLSPIEEFRTKSSYDLRGNLINVTDALGRKAFIHIYDLANRLLRIESIDAGIRRIVFDAAGNEIERRDSKGAIILHAYDDLNRPVRLWARDAAGLVTLRERLEYGEVSDPGHKLANRLGRLHKHFDEAGLLTFDTYDFKGNIAEKVRHVIADTVILTAINSQTQTFQVDWETQDATDLDQTEYQTSIRYDALNRVKLMTYPEDEERERKQLLPRYNQAGALEHVEFDGAVYVEHIAYNAKGQRALIAYGNGVMTRYAYDRKTFRLARMRTERYNKTGLIYHPGGDPLQEFGYEYDLVGNITMLHDRTPGSGVMGADSLDRIFTYDPIYRLLTANGRECDAPPTLPWDEKPKCTDVTQTRGYNEEYHYDKVGNLERLEHKFDSAGFVRKFTLVPGTNRLDTIEASGVVSHYFYDDNGNLTKENTERHFEWDHSDRLRAFRNQPANAAAASIHAQYFYDAGGQRVKKLVRKNGTVETTVYIDGVYERHTVSGTSPSANNTLHVMDNERRIATVRAGEPFEGDKTPPVKFHLGDHLGSSNVVVDDSGAFINREEYTPYGETSFGSFARKRYRFTGKERDEESGLYYHGARYYSPWLGRWTTTDPAGLVDGPNAYCYARENPIQLVDPTGRQGDPPPPTSLPPPSGPWDVDADRIVRRPYEAGAGPSKFPRDMKAKGNRLAEITGFDPKDRQLGHEPGTPSWKERAGDKGYVRNERATGKGGNMSRGATIERPAAQRAKAAGEFAREKGNDPSAPAGARRSPKSLIAGTKTRVIPPSAGAKALSLARKGLSLLGKVAKGVNVVGNVNQVSEGFIKIKEGKTAEGLVDIGEVGANLGLSAATAVAVKTGAITTGVGAGAAFLATGAAVAAGGSIALVAETIRAVNRGEQAPYETAVEFWGDWLAEKF